MSPKNNEQQDFESSMTLLPACVMVAKIMNANVGKMRLC